MGTKCGQKAHNESVATPTQSKTGKKIRPREYSTIKKQRRFAGNKKERVVRHYVRPGGKRKKAKNGARKEKKHGRLIKSPNEVRKDQQLVGKERGRAGEG